MMKETGKGRKSRIELGYYHTPDRLLRLRRLLWVVAIIATGGLLLAAGIADRPANSHSWSIVPRRIASKGPVAEPHAMWDANCEACHTDFVSINSTRWSPSFWNGSTAESAKCTNCHAGPAHHKSERQDDVPACAECHRDSPRARCFAAGCGQFELHGLSSESARPSRRWRWLDHRCQQRSQGRGGQPIRQRPSSRLERLVEIEIGRSQADQIQPRVAPGRRADASKGWGQV